MKLNIRFPLRCSASLTLIACLIGARSFSAESSLNPLDPTFGNCGKVITEIGVVADHTLVHIQIQSDGKVVTGAAGKLDGAGARFALARYHPDGRLDSTFGIDGIAVLDFPGFIGGSTALDRNGQVVVVGHAPQGATGLDWVIGRLNLNGSMDTSFDGDGWAVIDFSSGDDYFVHRGQEGQFVAVDSQNRIVIQGKAINVGGGNSFARLNSNGSLDTTFDGDGRVTHSFAYDALCMTLDSSDRVLAAGYVDHQPTTGTDFFVLRMNVDGALDPSFDADGKVTIDFENKANVGILIEIDGQGRVVVVGSSEGGITAIARLNDNGSLDNSFSGDGKFELAFDGTTSLAVDNVNRIVLGGYSYTCAPGNCTTADFEAFRITANGDLDHGLGGDGRVTVNFCGSSYEVSYDLATDSQNNILLAGRIATGPSAWGVALARLLSGDVPLPTTPCLPAPAVIACGADLSILANPEGLAMIPDLRLQATLTGVDACNPATVTQNPPPGTLVSCGAYPVTLILTDASGQHSSCTQTVTVLDPTPPLLTCPPAVLAPFGSVPAPAATLADFITQGGSVSGTCNAVPTITSTDSISGICPMVITRNYTATGPSGGSSTCQQIITVQNLLPGDGIIWHQPLARNGASEDTDPGAGGTLKYRFKLGSTIPIKIHVQGCTGNDLTGNANVVGTVEVFGDTNCDGVTDANASAIDFNGVGEAGGIMDKIGSHLQFNLDTKKLPNTSNCYILQVTVTDSSTGETIAETVPLQAK